MIHKHPSVEAMMWISTDGLHEPLPAMVEPLIVMGRKGVDLPLQIVGLVGTEELFLKLCLQLCPTSNGPRSQ